MKPSEFPEVQQYGRIKNLLENALDMRFADLRVMLHLPCRELEAGCNLPAATLLLEIMAGCSVSFYVRGGKIGLETDRDRGPRFKELLMQYYPWQGESLQPVEAVRVFWEFVRNPLAHSLGFRRYRLRDQVMIAKDPCSDKQIDELETNPLRPDWLQFDRHTIWQVPSGSGFVVYVPTLYWGLHQLLHNLFSDAGQMSKVEAYYS